MRTTWLLSVMLIALVAMAAHADPSFHVWVADPLAKVLRDSPPVDQPGQISVRAARNEYESAQIVVTAVNAISSLTASVSAISGPGSVKPSVTRNFVGYVPVEHGTPYTLLSHLVAVAPCDFPDPLLESSSVSVEAGKNQPIWLTVRVPANTRPGRYTGSVTVTGDGESVSVPLSIEVSPAMLPSRRTLSFTNWFNIETIADYHGLTQWSEAYWTVLATYGQFMANYRMNTIRSQLNRLIIARDDGSGQYAFDFSRFDRWVELFKSVGAIGTIEGGHICGRLTYEGTDFYVWFPTLLNPDGSTKPKPPPTVATSPEAVAWYSQFLPALQQHLEQKGWIDSYIQHVGDEPLSQSAASYRGVAAIVRQYAPRFRIVDAIECTDLVGAVDIWVPQTRFYGDNRTFFEQRKAAGEQVWVYTCLTPKGEYMNRFVDYPLIDVRLLHWVNFKYNLPGYLHWGLNFWHGDPFTKIEYNWGSPTSAFQPPGDTHIVYKGAYGPLSSIRLEALRDGIEDYELLRLLARKDPARAQAMCDSVVRSLTDYTRDSASFRGVRWQLLDALAENPLSVDQTKALPPDSQVFMLGGVVTADLRYPSGSMNLFYVEKEDRSSGIGVVASGSASYTPGQRVEVYGRTRVLDGAELVVEPDAVSVYSGAALRPLGAAHTFLGGGPFGAQQGVIDDAFALPEPLASRGVNSVGKLVRMWGLVTGSAQTAVGQVFWIDDGSKLRDGFQTAQDAQAVGLGVLLPPGMWDIPTGRVCVTGILRAIPNPSGQVVRLLVPRDGSDILQ